MKTYSFEAKPVDGIPTLSETDIESILHQNARRAVNFTKEQILLHLETLKNDHAEHTEQNKTPPGLVPGPPCPHCKGEFYIRTGVCLTCVNCSESSSCG